MAELKKKTIKGALWSFFDSFTNQGISFLVGIILARLLLPSDYGMIAMISLFIAISKIFVNSGFRSALVRKQDCTEADLNTAFVFNISVGLFFYLFLFLAAPYISIFFNQPQLTGIIRTQGICVIFASLSLVQSVRYARNIDFKTTMKVSVISNCFSGIVGILLAYGGYGVWAIVYMTLTCEFVSTCLLWLFSPWKPSLFFSKGSFKYLFGYGSKLLCASLIDVLFQNINPIIIGKFFSASSLGYFTKANTFANLPSANLNHVIQKVTFPVLSKMQDNIVTLRTNYRRIIKMTAFIVFPSMIGLAAIAKPLIIVLLTEKWNDTILLLQIICFSMMWYPIHSLNLNLLEVKGRSDLFLRLEIIKKILYIIIVCVSVWFGVVGLCVGGVVCSLLCLVINTYYTGRLIKVGFKVQMLDILPILINSLIMGIIVFSFSIITNNSIVSLGMGVVSGVFYYIISSYFFKFPELNECIEIIRDLF